LAELFPSLNGLRTWHRWQSAGYRCHHRLCLTAIQHTNGLALWQRISSFSDSSRLL